jgi:hypothetical protein
MGLGVRLWRSALLSGFASRFGWCGSNALPTALVPGVLVGLVLVFTGLVLAVLLADKLRLNPELAGVPLSVPLAPVSRLDCFARCVLGVVILAGGSSGRADTTGAPFAPGAAHPSRFCRLRLSMMLKRLEGSTTSFLLDFFCFPLLLLVVLVLCTVRDDEMDVRRSTGFAGGTGVDCTDVIEGECELDGRPRSMDCVLLLRLLFGAAAVNVAGEDVEVGSALAIAGVGVVDLLVGSALAERDLL